MWRRRKISRLLFTGSLELDWHSLLKQIESYSIHQLEIDHQRTRLHLHRLLHLGKRLLTLIDGISVHHAGLLKKRLHRLRSVHLRKDAHVQNAIDDANRRDDVTASEWKRNPYL